MVIHSVCKQTLNLLKLIYDHYEFIDFQNKNKTIYTLAPECPSYIITQMVYYYASKTQCDLNTQNHFSTINLLGGLQSLSG
jgi:hypothetical protein